MSEPLHAILYRSISTQTFSSSDLRALVDHAQTRNATRGVTGILLYGSMRALPQIPGTFVQWLEGPEEAVRALYDTVSSDPRHQDVEVYADASLASMGLSDRLFGRWAMGVASMSDLPASLAGFLSDYREQNLGRVSG